MPRLSADISQVLEDLVRRIVAAVEPERIILCGSVARGAMGPDGDIDMGPLTDEIFLTLEGLGLPGDVIMATPEDVERYRHSPLAVFTPAVEASRGLNAA